jgi:hypothetical protein
LTVGVPVIEQFAAIVRPVGIVPPEQVVAGLPVFVGVIVEIATPFVNV